MFSSKASAFGDSNNSNFARDFLVIPKDQLLMMESRPGFQSSKNKPASETLPEVETVSNSKTKNCEPESIQNDKSENPNLNTVSGNDPPILFKHTFGKDIENSSVSRGSLPPSILFNSLRPQPSSMKRASSFPDIAFDFSCTHLSEPKGMFSSVTQKIKEHFSLKERTPIENASGKNSNQSPLPVLREDVDKVEVNVSPAKGPSSANISIAIFPQKISPIKAVENTLAEKRKSSTGFNTSHLIPVREENEPGQYKEMSQSSFLREVNLVENVFSTQANQDVPFGFLAAAQSNVIGDKLQQRVTRLKSKETSSIHLKSDTSVPPTQNSSKETTIGNVDTNSTSDGDHNSINMKGVEASAGNLVKNMSLQINAIDEAATFKKPTHEFAKQSHIEDDSFGSQPIPCGQSLPAEIYSSKTSDAKSDFANAMEKSVGGKKREEVQTAAISNPRRKRKRSDKGLRHGSAKSARKIEINFTAEEIKNMIELIKRLP